jgi:hypothetical protein
MGPTETLEADPEADDSSMIGRINKTRPDPIRLLSA